MAVLNTLRGIAAIIFITLNTMLVWIPLTWWCIERLWARDAHLSRLRKRMDKIIWWWTNNNRRMLRWLNLTQPQITWHDQGTLSADKWYLVISNHQSWTDILLLQSYLYGVLPPLKFFTKQELIWVPGVGLAMHVLGFPYVKRATKDQIKANPKLKTADRDSVATACEGFKNHPTSVLNFIEGTRRTAEKQARQNSEYEYLLRPKIGGIDYVMEDLIDHLHKLIDVTIIYPKGVPTFWEFLKGECSEVKMEIIPRDIPEGAGQHDASGRRNILSQWIKALWEEKDSRIASHLAR